MHTKNKSFFLGYNKRSVDCFVYHFLSPAELHNYFETSIRLFQHISNTIEPILLKENWHSLVISIYIYWQHFLLYNNFN